MSAAIWRTGAGEQHTETTQPRGIAHEPAEFAQGQLAVFRLGPDPRVLQLRADRAADRPENRADDGNEDHGALTSASRLS
ncbi:hypothetical protein ABZ639_30200 [Saccharomonospora sp. NPDC006951]